MFNFGFNPLTAFFVAALVGNSLTFVRATPLFFPLDIRDVIAPKIITPNADTVWTVGHVETVTWDTSTFPDDSQITNPIGKVILGHEENDSLNLDFDHPLAEGFKLRDGSVQLTVPDIPPRNDYIIVLYGDSGNTSPAFSITKIRVGSSSPSPSPSSASSSSGAAPSLANDTPSPPHSAATSATTATRPSSPSPSVARLADTSTTSTSVLSVSSQQSSSSSSSSSSSANSGATPGVSPPSTSGGQRMASFLRTGDMASWMALTTMLLIIPGLI